MNVNKCVEKGYTLNKRYQNGQTATDKVLHQRLLKKLSCPCDRINVLLLIISSLKDMKQKAGPHGHFQCGGIPVGFLRNSCCELYSVKAKVRAGLCTPGPGAVEERRVQREIVLKDFKGVDKRKQYSRC